MKTRTIKVTSLFPASKTEVFRRLQQFETLSKIAYPYITFTPLNGDKNLLWQPGETFTFKAKLLGFIPFGIHKINVIEFDQNGRIYTNEQNTYVSVWNHLIILKEVAVDSTEYSDEVEIYAGWKTFFVYLWASLFYRHRQRRWIKMLKS
ncbi:MAG: hypothetical protein CR995_00685 [Clostridiales bacterium]|nr:MAG: hypothetical protein CR995_00685 [Clostridiales bacterium]